MKKRIGLFSIAVLLVLLAGLMGMNLLNPLPGNPPQRHSGVILSEESDAVLRRDCFDCHSNETRYPWYAHLPGISALLAHHIKEGRKELNFSLWDTMSASKRRENLAESFEAIRKGSMPMTGYTLLHPEARLSTGDIALLEQGATQTFGPGVLTEGGKEGHSKGGEEDDEDEEDHHDGKKDDD